MEAEAGANQPGSADAKDSAPILVIGPMPPPWHGVATCMRDVVAIAERGVPLVVLDTADRRGLANIGRLDWGNVKLGLEHAVQNFWLLLSRRPALVFLFISQGTLPFLRDFCFLAPAILMRRRLVIHLQGGYFRDFYESSGPVIQAMIRWTVGSADRVLVLGEQLKPIFDGLVAPERLLVLPNAVDPEPYRRMRAAEPEKAAESGVVLTYMATISREKGALDFLRAVPAIRSRVPDARIVIAGEVLNEDNAAEIEKIMSRLELHDVVECPGVVTGEDKLRLLVDSDVFVFPTRYPYEGHPYVLLEAMAAGLPILTTDQGCIDETVTDGRNGLLVPQGDVEAIADAAIRLASDAGLRKAMSEANLRRIEADYTLSEWQDELLGIFEDTLRHG